MTISSTANKIIFNGNGATTSFPFTFPAIAATDILAYYTDSAGTITTLVQGSGTTQYQVSLTAAVPPNPTGIGGTVTYNPSGVPIAAGTTLTIIRTMPLTQTTSLANQGTLYQTVIEQSLDALLAQIQQINELLGRNIAVAVSDPTPSALPAAAARAGKFLSFDSSGNPIVSTTVTGTAVSAAMIPVVSAATLAAGRTAFGLGNIAVENIGSGLQDDGAGTLRANLEITTADTINQAVTSAFHNTQRAATGPITYTLPRANTLWNGFGFKIENLQTGGDVTLAINANDTFQNYTSGTSLIIGRGATLEFWTDAAASGTWYYNVVGGKKLVGDVAYVIVPGDRNILTTTTLTTTRAWTLPLASSIKGGTQITISDQANAVSSTNQMSVDRQGADTMVLQGTTITSLRLVDAGAQITLISDGVSKWNVLTLRRGPGVQRFITGGPLTYTATVGCTRQRVTGTAGGGGGGARGTNNGTNGTSSSFQVNATGTAWTAVLGQGGTLAGAGGTGGTGGVNGSLGTLIDRWPGADGGVSAVQTDATGDGQSIFTGGTGGASIRGGAGMPAATTGGSAKTNSGSGGAGGNSLITAKGGGGGGAGESVSFWVTGMTSATYTVGAKGTGGAAGGSAGGDGGDGIWIVEEFFD